MVHAMLSHVQVVLLYVQVLGIMHYGIHDCIRLQPNVCAAAACPDWAIGWPSSQRVRCGGVPPLGHWMAGFAQLLVGRDQENFM